MKLKQNNDEFIVEIPRHYNKALINFDRLEEQLKFLENGNISPCPYKDRCLNNPLGCKGISYWCRRMEE